MLDRMQPALSMTPGPSKRRAQDNLRYGTTTMFAPLDIATGKVIGELHRCRRAKKYLQILRTGKENAPSTFDVYLVMDDYGTHKTPAVKRWSNHHPRLFEHYTPISALWLNQVECWLADRTMRQIRLGSHRSTITLEKPVRAHLKIHSEDFEAFVWNMSADNLLAGLPRSHARTSNSGY